LILTPCKVEESFLLYACRKSNRILKDNCSGIVIEFAVERPRIRNGKAILDRVVGVKAPGAGIGGRNCMSQLRLGVKSTVPAGRRFCAIPELAPTTAMPAGLLPRFDIQPLPKAALNAYIGRGQVILEVHRRELLIVGSPSNHQGSLSPWRANAKINRSRQVPANADCFR
jgi:hypothetical protein